MNKEACDALRKFMEDMKRWEEDLDKAQDDAEDNCQDLSFLKDKYRNRLSALFDKYSVSEGLNRERLIDLGSFIPVTYDPERDTVEEVLESGVEFLVTQNSGFRSRFKFFMVNLKGNWLIKKKQRLSDGKWVASAL